MRKLLIAVCAVAAACGGGGGGATAPTPVGQAPTITTSNTMIYIGQKVQFAATGSGIRWGGDNNAVATIDQSSGMVTGVGNGRVTIWAENSGGRTTRLLRGLPSYAGTWRGNYTVQGCQSNGIFMLIQFCGNSFYQGQSMSMQLGFSQTDDRLSSGTLALGSITGTLTDSSVAEDGQVRMTGTTIPPDPTNPIRVSLENVRLESPAAGTIRGEYEMVWSHTTLSGTARVWCNIEALTRTSGGPSLRLLTPPAGLLTLDDIVRAMHEKR